MPPPPGGRRRACSLATRRHAVPRLFSIGGRSRPPRTALLFVSRVSTRRGPDRTPLACGWRRAGKWTLPPPPRILGAHASGGGSNGRARFVPHLGHPHPHLLRRRRPAHLRAVAGRRRRGHGHL